MPRCSGCGRFFRTQGGLQSHIAMVRRTGRHYPRRGGGRKTYRRIYR